MCGGLHDVEATMVVCIIAFFSGCALTSGGSQNDQSIENNVCFHISSKCKWTSGWACLCILCLGGCHISHVTSTNLSKAQNKEVTRMKYYHSRCQSVSWVKHSLGSRLLYRGTRLPEGICMLTSWTLASCVMLEDWAGSGSDESQSIISEVHVTHTRMTKWADEWWMYVCTWEDLRWLQSQEPSHLSCLWESDNTACL